MIIDEFFHGVSTLIQISALDLKSRGTGFFYEEKNQNNHDSKFWIVTNRHVILSKISDKEIVPDTFTFNLRKENPSGSIVWYPIQINKDELLKRALFHSDASVDVGMVEVTDLLKKEKEKNKIVPWHAITKENIPDEDEVDVSDDVVAIGYPRGFHDKVNVFPIVKAGIISTRWGFYFNGRPYFLIDAKLFPGSSGSLVITKPEKIVIENDTIVPLKEKQFKFLGVYSGEPFYQQPPIESDGMTIILKSTFNVGTVWYSSLVEEILKKGSHIL